MPYKATPHRPYSTPRPSPHRLGYTKAWYALSAQAIAAQPWCTTCYTTTDLTTDHVIPMSRGGTSTWDNVQVLCRSCNSKKRNAQARMG